jgi:FtsH-binding integral membrane protein
MLPKMTMQFSSCLFFVLLLLSLSLSITNIADENKTNKTMPISVLIVNSIVIALIVLQSLGIKLNINIPQFGVIVFLLVLILSFILSLQNVTDDDLDNKSFSVIVLIITIVVLLMMGYRFLNTVA